MRSNKRSILTPISPIVIPNVKSYWATHFYSVLKCIDSHNNLMHSPRKFKEFPLWTLSFLRGNSPLNFFDQIESYIKNWGVQYFLASFFNQKIGEHIIVELLERLEDLYGICFNRNLDSFAFYVSGRDSSLSYKLQERFTETFPFKTRNNPISNLINYSDLCLIIENNFNNSSVGIFGEVEGIYGNKFRSESYWGKKDEFCVFGIGVVEGSNKLVYFEESHHKEIPRVHLLFEKSHFIVSDFLTVLNCFKHLFIYGPTYNNYFLDDEFNYFYSQMKYRWSDPIEEVFIFLEGYIDGGDLVGFNNTGIEIITDLQA